MPLTDEERKAIVVYRLEKADGAYVEAKDMLPPLFLSMQGIKPKRMKEPSA